MNAKITSFSKEMRVLINYQCFNCVIVNTGRYVLWLHRVFVSEDNTFVDTIIPSIILLYYF